MKFIFLKKYLILIIIFSLVFSSLFIAPAKKAEALTAGEAVGKAVGMGAACFLEQYLEGNIKRLLFTPQSIAEGYKLLGEFPIAVPTVNLAVGHVNVDNQVTASLNQSKQCIRDVVAKVLLDWVTDETVQWIQGGGEPGYVTDWGTFAKDAFNAGVGAAINETTFKSVCSPFRRQVKISLLPVQRFDQQLTCTFDQIKLNVENFYKDFSSGGWIAYADSWQPQNNYFGTMMMLTDEAYLRAMQEKQKRLDEAMASRGFLGVKRLVCNKDPAELNDCYTLLTEEERNLCLADVSCKEEIVTPGTAVGELVGKAITNDSTWASNIQSWVAALVNAIINRVTKEGLGYLTRSDDSSGSSVSGGNFDPWYGYDRTGGVQEQALKDITDQLQKISDDLFEVRFHKQSSLSNKQNTLAAMQSIKSQGCQPPVSDSDITNVQSAVTQLTNDLANIDGLIALINDFRNYLSGISADLLVSVFPEIQKIFQDFSTKAGSYGSVTQALDAAISSQQELQTMQQRLNSCSTTPSF